MPNLATASLVGGGVSLAGISALLAFLGYKVSQVDRDHPGYAGDAAPGVADE